MRLTRFTLFTIALIIGAGFYLLVRRQLEEVEPQTFQATEESMVDTANLMASIVEASLENDPEFDPELLREGFNKANERSLEARIFEHLKTEVGMNCYITDAKGIVIFDSNGGAYEGMDFSSYNDVRFTLAGKYGARSSRVDKNDKSTSVLHVAAPIGDPAEPWGVLTINKPQSDVFPIVRRRRAEVWWGTGLVGGGILFLVMTVFIWQYRPISKLTDYANDIRQGKRPPMPKLGAGREVNTLASALESMRESLEGRKFAERYVQTLTHEMKSPIAAIRGAAELLDEPMSDEDRHRFLHNIRAETTRADRLLNRLHELAALEGQSRLDRVATFDLRDIVRRAVDQSRPVAELADVTLNITLPDEEAKVRGDAFTIRAAVTNLLENAIDFSPKGGEVVIHLKSNDPHTLTIDDSGPGIPDYAREKVFDRFFSLRHLNEGRKGTGLGLTLVKEAAELHEGSVTLDDREPNGTRATLLLPCAG